jgi:hypothetical protein
MVLWVTANLCHAVNKACIWAQGSAAEYNVAVLSRTSHSAGSTTEHVGSVAYLKPATGTGCRFELRKFPIFKTTPRNVCSSCELLTCARAYACVCACVCASRACMLREFVPCSQAKPTGYSML